MWIDVPDNSSIMLSFSYFGLKSPTTCFHLTLEVYVGETLVYRCEAYGRSPQGGPELYDVGDLRVHFTNPNIATQYPRLHRGFKLAFSIHDKNAMPQKLPSGKWNCSVPHYQDFQLHFSCDMEAQCEDGQDEVTCPYTSALCGQGFITLDNRCYMYLVPPGRTTWIDASALCQARDAELVAMETPEEWAKVTELMFQRYVFRYSRGQSYKSFVALQSTASHLPRM